MIDVRVSRLSVVFFLRQTLHCLYTCKDNGGYVCPVLDRFKQHLSLEEDIYDVARRSEGLRRYYHTLSEEFTTGYSGVRQI